MKSLKIKIPVLIIALVIFATIFSAYVSYNVASKEVKQHIINKNEIIANMISDQVSQYLLDAQNTVEYVAKNSDVADMEKIKKEINKVYNSYRWVDVMFYMTPEGTITYSQPHNDVIYQRNYVERGYYKYLMENKSTYISKVFISSLLNQPHIIIVSPILDETTGQVKGIIGGGVPLESIQEIVQKTQQSYDGKIYVIDSERKTLVSPDYKGLSKKILLERRIQIDGKTMDLEEIFENYAKGVGEYKNGPQTVYVSFSKIENYEGLIIVERDEEYIGKEIKRIQRELLPWVLLIIVIVLLLSISFAYTITDPIEKLVIYARKMSKDIHQGMEGFKVTKDNEIGELELAFSGMSQELSKKIADLKCSHKREKDTKKYLNNILRSAGTGIIVIDDKDKIIIFNKAAEKITGIKEDEFIGENVYALIKSINLPKTIFNKNLKASMMVEEEYKIKKNDGVEVPISMMISPIYDDASNIIGLVCLMKDLSQIKMLEQQIKREDRLKTIGELSSSIIHEIGNPLAGMTNLLEVLKDNIADEDLRDELIFAIREEVGMLNQIVINFLEFTRMHNNKKTDINILHVLDSALNILKPKMRYKNIRIIKKFPREIPSIRVDPPAMRQALVNILKNSIEAVGKFGMIELNVQILDADEKELIVSIKDNGAGMNEEMMDRIFNPFFTTKEDGTGLGLSIVHKIITDSGGSITVKSELGKYTEFILSFKGDRANESIDY
ncbi:sensor histidine kinase [Marinisporobacter balticus]|uniref:histidine kinase n=1 Tax=Marinisporobacter balticus TaxID=2018667 RepID=A0A4R2KG37_9FIRM|nr:PAS domain-containing sensor histidine kinase [Marinisporobacter balticus]TCO71352.1 PAS domain S-box-containing protein [Marinisporobacter balticus]